MINTTTNIHAELAVDARYVVMVGDNLEWDVGGPQSIGMRGIWLDWRGGGLPYTTDVTPLTTIVKPIELLDILGL